MSFPVSLPERTFPEFPGIGKWQDTMTASPFLFMEVPAECHLLQDRHHEPPAMMDRQGVGEVVMWPIPRYIFLYCASR